MAKQNCTGREKSAAIRQRLIATAEVLGRGAQLPSVRHLCRSLGVSVATLDKVLGQLEQEGVLLCRHGSGVFVAEDFGRVHVALIYDEAAFHSSGSPFPRLLVEETRKRAALLDERFSILLEYARDQKGASSCCSDDLKRAVRNNRWNGALLVGCQNKALLEYLHEHDVATVEFGDLLESPFQVTLDYKDLLIQGLSYLASKGIQNPWLLLPFADNSNRNSALKSACREIFLEHTKSQFAHIHCPPRDACDLRADTEQFFLKAFAEGKKPEALLSLDDAMTVGAWRALDACGHNIPVVSHSNEGSPILAVLERRITRLEFSIEEMIAGMFELLERQLGNAKTPGETRSIQSKLFEATAHRLPVFPKTYETSI